MAESIPLKPTTQRGDSQKRFSTSTYKIPTPGIERTRPPRYEPILLRPWVVGTLILSMIVLAIAVEVALAISNKQQGFGVKQNNIFPVSASVLTSFFPILILIPASALWKSTDRAVLYWQPYIMLSKGNQRAEDTVLLDYLSTNALTVAITAFTRQHWLVQASMATALITNLFQPLAGSVFDVKQIAFAHPTTVTSIRTLDVPPDVFNLNAFDAAEGFTNTAIFQNLQPPPFVSGEWAIAEFDIPSDPGLNAAVEVDTTGVQTLVNCSALNSTLSTTNPTSFTVNVQDSDGCSATASFNPNDSEQQYGVVPVNAETCGFSAAANVTVLPVVFWFFEFNGTGTEDPVVKTVLCRPQIALFDVLAAVNYNNGSLTNVQPLNNYTAPTNITSWLAEADGQALNGVIFNQSNNTFIQARADAIKSGVSGTIFRFAAQNDATLQQYFESDTLFLNRTIEVYTEYLSVSAKLVYFVPTVENLSAQKTSTIARLVVVPLPSHALAVVLLVVAISGAVIHFLHRHERRHVYLTHPPGSIAASTALGYYSGFGEVLLPYDNDKTMAHKLRSLRFGFEQRTGAIYAEDLEEDRSSDELPVARLPKADEKALLNPHEQAAEETLEDPHARTPVSGGFEPYPGDDTPRGEASGQVFNLSYAI